MASLRPKPAPIVACTISRDLRLFDRLVDEMEVELAENWADIALQDAAAFLRAHSLLKFALIALDSADEGDPAIPAAIAAAQEAGIRVILVAQDLSPAAMQAMLRLGPDEVLPYPLTPGAIRTFARGPLAALDSLGPVDDLPPEAIRPSRMKRGRVLAVMGMAGGVGSTTIATNLAWELSANGRVCLISDGELSLSGRVQILPTAPSVRAVELARFEYDFVVLDLPSSAAGMLDHVDACLAVMQPDIRSARNAQRLAHPKLRPLLNRAPGLADIAGRRRWSRTAHAMGLEGVLHLPDGGAAVTLANDHGLPLAQTAARNPMRRAMVRLADMLRT